MISKKSHYGLKALLYLARRAKPTLIAEVAEAERIPVKFLQTILLSLRNAGLLTSRMGKGGGYALALEPSNITMADVFQALEGGLAPLSCLEGASDITCPECEGTTACGMKMVMGDIWGITKTILDNTTLAGLLERIKQADKIRQGIIDFDI